MEYPVSIWNLFRSKLLIVPSSQPLETDNNTIMIIVTVAV